MNACSPAGTGAVVFGDVTEAESWGDEVWDVAGTGRGQWENP